METYLRRVQCFASDVDESALVQARKGIYSSTDVIGISPELLEKYFEQTETGYVFQPELHRTIIFSRHDLTRDAPFSKIDLLSCRNVLIYFNLETQASIQVRFHFALNNKGFLFLGKAESLVNPRQVFTPVHLKHRIYAKGLRLELDDYLSIIPKSHRRRQLTLTG